MTVITRNHRTESIVEGVEDGVDFDAHYAISGHSGVAWVLFGWALTWAPAMMLCIDDDGYEWEEPDGDDEGEWVEDHAQVVAVMVGDDGRRTFDRDEPVVLDEEGFCHGCGQIGCTAEVWS